MNTAKRIETNCGDYVEDLVCNTVTKLHNAHVMAYGHTLAHRALEMGGGYFQEAIESFEYMSHKLTIPEEVGRYIRAWPCYPVEAS